ncbi:ras-related protein rab-22A-like protein [Backusella circina FSU 941]|nr:ras-related protein rab-22A-like protein [Backusella circina FSU 941]
MNTLEAKVVILGSTGVGKTSVAVRYVKNTFSPNGTSTIGASFMTKKLSVDSCSVRLQIWDTAGQERFRAMAPMYYRGASAAILVYDITSEESFAEMISWMDELDKNMTADLVIHVVGNKIDLASERKVPFQKVLDYCKRQHQVNGVHEVSAKDNNGIDDLFYEITQTLVNNIYNQDINIPSSTLGKPEEPISKSGCC